MAVHDKCSKVGVWGAMYSGIASYGMMYDSGMSPMLVTLTASCEYSVVSGQLLHSLTTLIVS